MIFPLSVFTISEKESVISEFIKISISSSVGVLLVKVGRRVSTERVKVLFASDPSAFILPAES